MFWAFFRGQGVECPGYIRGKQRDLVSRKASEWRVHKTPRENTEQETMDTSPPSGRYASEDEDHLTE
jgi:hypothetical protein